MAETVRLGEITCPSGELVLMDGGYLGLWSGDRSPDEVPEPDAVPAVDLEIVGPDADAAARAIDLQSGRTLYDIPRQALATFTERFDGRCRELGLTASLRPFDRRVPHRDRARRAIAGNDPDFLITGVAVVAVGGLPTDRPLPVTAAATPEWGRAHIRIQVTDEPVAEVGKLGRIGVDWARFAFADADALGAWVHDDPAGPRSHHREVMAAVRASEHEAATIEVGGARLMFAMTSVGDGFFPVHVERDASGAPAAIQVNMHSDGR